MVDLSLTDFILLLVGNGIVDTLFVAWVAGTRSKIALVKWLKSKEAGPYYDLIAEKAEARILPKLDERLGHMEARISSEMPHADTQLADMKKEIASKIEAVDHGISRAMEVLDSQLASLPETIKMTVLSLRGVAMRRMNAAVEGAAEGIVTEAMEEEGFDPDSPEGQFMSWLRAPVKEDPDRPWIAGGVKALKAALSREMKATRGRGYMEGSSSGEFAPVR